MHPPETMPWSIRLNHKELTSVGQIRLNKTSSFSSEMRAADVLPVLPIRRKLERLESKNQLSFKNSHFKIWRDISTFFETWDLNIYLPGMEARYYGNGKNIKVENRANFLRLSVV